MSRKDEKHLEPSRVRHVTVSASGEWMATIDSRIGDEGFRPEVYLKIWWWDRKSGFWILNSRINRPHGLNEITSVSFSPILAKERMLLATTGEDKQVKMWRLRTNVDRKGEVEGTTCFTYVTVPQANVSWQISGFHDPHSTIVLSCLVTYRGPVMHRSSQWPLGHSSQSTIRPPTPSCKS